MNRLKLMSLAAAAAICVAPVAWAMGPTDRDEQTEVIGSISAPDLPSRSGSVTEGQVRLASGCEAGERIDRSTADTARTKMESAGYRGVRGLKKGCDNVWHGMASKDGRETGVVLTSQGQVMLDGD
jgi:hypothetical protein